MMARKVDTGFGGAFQPFSKAVRKQEPRSLKEKDLALQRMSSPPRRWNLCAPTLVSTKAPKIVAPEIWWINRVLCNG